MRNEETSAVIRAGVRMEIESNASISVVLFVKSSTSRRII
jgi:hypothetical protein